MPTTAETVAEYFAAIRALDADRFANAFAPDGVSEDPVGTPPMKGRAALHAFMSHLADSFASVSLVEDGVYLCAKSAAVKWKGHAEARNGKTVDFEGVDVIDCDDEGLINHVRAFWDPGPVMAILQG